MTNRKAKCTGRFIKNNAPAAAYKKDVDIRTKSELINLKHKGGGSSG